MGLENLVPGDVLWADGQDNMGGLSTIHAYAPVSDFLTINEPPEDPATFADAAKISAAHVFKPGKGWRKLYTTEDTSGLMDESVGEKDGKSYKNKATLFHPGTKDDLLGMARYLNNTGIILLVQESEGAYRQVGSSRFPAKVDTNTIDTTTTTDGRKGMTAEIGAASHYPAPIYPFAVNFLSDSGSGV